MSGAGRRPLAPPAQLDFDSTEYNGSEGGEGSGAETSQSPNPQNPDHLWSKLRTSVQKGEHSPEAKKKKDLMVLSAVGSGAMAAAMLRDRVEGLKDQTNEDEWMDPIDVKSAEEIAAEEYAARAGLEASAAEEAEAEELIKQRQRNIAADEARKANAARVMQRFGKRWLHKFRGIETDLLSMVRGFIGRRRSMLLNVAGAAVMGDENGAIDHEAANQLTETFGRESLAGRKPIVVTGYMEEHELHEFITGNLVHILNKLNLPANPYPELMVRMRTNYVEEIEFIKLTNRQLKAVYDENMANIEDRDLDGYRLPACYFKNMHPEETFWGDQRIMRAVDPTAIAPLRKVLKEFVGTKIVEKGADGKLIVGRALVGRSIYHQKSSPFPASIEMADECMWVGPNFELSLESYVDHVIEDLEEIVQDGVHVLLSPLSVGIATPDGEYQRFSEWTLKDFRERRRVFAAELVNSTVNKRNNKIDILFRVQMREVPGAVDTESEESQGGWGFLSCRKYYGFHFHSGSEFEPWRSYVQGPFQTLWRGLFFEKEAATLYANKRLPDGTGGHRGYMFEELLDPFLYQVDMNLETADFEGDALLVAEMCLAPALLREGLGVKVDPRLMIKAQRIRASGSHFLRTLCDHLFAMERALVVIAKAVTEDVAMDENFDVNGFIKTRDFYKSHSREEAEKLSNTVMLDGQVVDMPANGRIVMGQLRWIYREIGKLIGTAKAGIDLDAMNQIIEVRMGKLVTAWILRQSLDPAETERNLKWLRNLCKACYMSYATTISDVDKIEVPRRYPLDSERLFEKAVIRDVVQLDKDIQRAIVTHKVPAALARESLQLQYTIDTGLDMFLEDMLRSFTDTSLFPIPKMRAMRLLRRHSQYFMLWKAYDLDVLASLSDLANYINPATEELGARATDQWVFVSQGSRPKPTPYGQPPPAVPQAGLWAPPGAPFAEPPAYGTYVALQSWFIYVAGAGEGAERVIRENRNTSSGSGNRGGVHFNTGFRPAYWWAGHQDIARCTMALRNTLPFSSKSFTCKVATAVRNVVVHPVPFQMVMNARFARITFYDYYFIEGPKRSVALQLACLYYVDFILHLHDNTQHIPFGIYINPDKPKKDPMTGEYESQPPAGFPGDIQNLEMPGAGDTLWSPSQLRQSQEAVLTNMRQALEEGRIIYTIGLYWNEGHTPQDQRQGEAKHTGSYSMYFSLLNIAYGHSSALISHEREGLYHERELFWPLDVHALFNNVFFTAEEAAMVAELYPREDLTLDPCGVVNSEQHLSSCVEDMGSDSSEGDYMDIIFAVWQRAVLSSYQENLNLLMQAQRNSESQSKEQAKSGRHYSNWRFGLRYPELSAMAEAYRLLHSVSAQLICLQHSLIGLAAVLAIQAPEAKLKVKLVDLAAQTVACKKRLLHVLTEEANKIYMHGLHRAIYNRVTTIEATVQAFLKKPEKFVTEIEAALPAPEEPFVVLSMEQVKEAQGVPTAALVAMLELQTHLTAIVQASSFTTYENCDFIAMVVKRDFEELAEKNKQKAEGTGKMNKKKRREGTHASGMN